MKLEIKSILKNKISAIIFFVLLLLNMVQMPKYMGNSYDVEQNMKIFENQIQQYQMNQSNVNLQYQALRGVNDEERMYWNAYKEYMNWAVHNAKEGWDLFNKYGDRVFQDTILLNKYNEITLWDKIYHLDSLFLHGDARVLQKVKQLQYQEPDIDFDKTKLYVIGSQISIDKKEDYNSTILMVKEQLYQIQLGEKPLLGKGPWNFLVNQLRIQSQFSYLFFPLCLVYSVCIFMDEKKSGVYEMMRLNNEHSYIRMQIKLIFSFILILLLSLLIPFLLLIFTNGLHGYNAFVLVDYKNLFSFKAISHTNNYILNNVSEYYATENGFIPNLSFIVLWKALLLTLVISLMKIWLIVSISLLCSFAFNKEWKNYVFAIVNIGFYAMSQKLTIFPRLNPYGISASWSVVSGCGKQSWLNAFCILFGFIVLLEGINYILTQRKDAP